MIIGLLHPGNMGAAIGARLVKAGHTVLWHGQGRSRATVERANSAGLTAVHELSELLEHASAVISICPSAVAIEVAEAAAEHNFNGVFVDANAVSPQQMQHMAAMLTTAGATAVDATISGPPPKDSPSARLFLSGPPDARALVSELLASAGLTVDGLGDTPGLASALKMALISYQRPARLQAAIAHGLADHYGVADALIAEATRIGADYLADRAALPGMAARAWRWIPETNEVAISLAEAGLPTDFADATAKLYKAYADDKDNWDLTPEKVIHRLALDGAEEPNT